MRKIIHVDMDCFYAAVEVKHQPELAGRPLGIGGPPNSRSVLCTASYEARKFGVRSAMPSSQAVRLCPELILLPPNFPLYKKESQAVREIFGRFSSCMEPLSLDEAYLDVTDSPHFGGSATLIAQEIRRLIRQELRLTASAGVAPNKFLAKIASDWRKPNGQFVIRPEHIPEFVRALPVEKIYGVGKVTAKRMHDLGLRTCADLQAQSPLQLRQWFGSRGEDLACLARGQDDRPVEAHSERKSLTVEETFGRDVATLDECLRVIPELYQDWERRMTKSNYRDRIRGMVVKAKFFDFQSTTHERTARGCPTVENFQELFRQIWARRSAPVRLIGLGVRLAGNEGEGQTPFQLKLAI
ncbi:MAG: DNA polymerase IV [Bdellovibrionales bacterium]|nr:DNA polymerase IV [Bdellovibrionales bacterium]